MIALVAGLSDALLRGLLGALLRFRI